MSRGKYKARVKKTPASQEKDHESGKIHRTSQENARESGKKSTSQEEPTSQEKSSYGQLLQSLFFHLARSKEKAADRGKPGAHVRETPSFSPSHE